MCGKFSSCRYEPNDPNLDGPTLLHAFRSLIRSTSVLRTKLKTYEELQELIAGSLLDPDLSPLLLPQNFEYSKTQLNSLLSEAAISKNQILVLKKVLASPI